MTDTVETFDAGTDVEIIASHMDLSAEIASINDGAIALYTSVDMSDFEGALAVAEAIGNSTPLRDVYGQEIEITDIVIQKVEIPNIETGEVNEAPRVTLITTDGRFLHATSAGVFSAVRNLFGLLGTPDKWPNRALTVKAVQETTRRGFFVTVLKPVRKSAKK